MNGYVEMALFVYLLPFAYAILEVAVEKHRLSPATRMPMWMLQSAPFVGFLLALARIAQRIAMEIRNGAPPAPETEAFAHFVEEAEEDLRSAPAADGDYDPLRTNCARKGDAS